MLQQDLRDRLFRMGVFEGRASAVQAAALTLSPSEVKDISVELMEHATQSVMSFDLAAHAADEVLSALIIEYAKV